MTAELPGYRVVDTAATVAEDGLRNDVAAFLGSTERGPLNLAVRVAGRQAYAAVFGGSATGSVPRAVAAYFSNGGEIAWVVRAGRDGSPARAALDLGRTGSDGGWTVDGPRRMSFPGTRLELTAATPGRWANGTQVRILYRAYGGTGAPEVDVAVTVPGQATVRRTGLAADELLDAFVSTGVVSASFTGPAGVGRPDDSSGPAVVIRTEVLGNGREPVMDARELQAAVEVQAEVEEIAMVCIPDLAELLPRADADTLMSELTS